MLIGPIFTREWTITPRRSRFYIARAVYAAVLTLLMTTAWLVLAGTQIIRNVGDMARFGTILFQVLCPLQLALVLFFAAVIVASSVALEKDRGTLILLLMTRMSNHELVLGKLMAGLLHVVVLIAAGLPIFMLSVLFGGVSFQQVLRAELVTCAGALVAGSLGAGIAFWREKTFQTLALTALVICLWIGIWEAVAAGVLGQAIFDIPCETWGTAFSPLRAIRTAAQPVLAHDVSWGPVGNSVDLFVLVSLALTGLMCLVTIARVRVWNPSRELRRRSAGAKDKTAALSEVARDVSEQAAVDTAGSSTMFGSDAMAETARGGHVDAQLRLRTGRDRTRQVWDNPVLWRELCTWTHGRKIWAIRFAYLVMFGLAAAALHVGIQDGSFLARSDDTTAALPPVAKPLAPLFLVSLVLVNALAVTSITTERDGKSLDLLLATDLSPKEFVFGKLAGVFSVAGLMVFLPMALTVYLWFRGGISTENLVYVFGGWMVMNVFVSMLGVHCGMRYANSRTAVGVSLGTVFFLFLGVAACILMMISFSGSFQVQLAPFLAFILGGGVGLHVALSARSPSRAIFTATLLLPFFTFHAITSFLLRYNLTVFLVTVCTYGFTTAAMMIPALYEFDFAMGRTSTAEE